MVTLCGRPRSTVCSSPGVGAGRRAACRRGQRSAKPGRRGGHDPRQSGTTSVAEHALRRGRAARRGWPRRAAPAGAQTGRAIRSTRRCARAGPYHGLRRPAAVPRIGSAAVTRATRRAQGRPGSLRQRQPRVVEQAAQDRRGAGLHHVEDARHERPAGPAAQHAVMSRNSRCPASARRGGPASGSATGTPNSSRDRRAEQPERGQAHRRDRPVEALRHAEAEVDRGARRVGRARSAGSGKSVVIGPGLGQPERAGRVDGPLDVLRRAVVRLDPVAERGQRADLRRRSRHGLAPPSGCATCSVPPPGSERIASRLSPGAARGSSPLAVSTTKWSGLTAPDTTASPRPGLASITAWRGGRSPGWR